MDSSFRPRLRPLETQWIERSGQPALLLQDRLAIGARGVVVPQLLVPLLALCDGTRDLDTLRAAYQLRTGIPLDSSMVEKIFDHLDEALMLDNDRFAHAYREALETYRSLPFRAPFLAGGGYPADARGLAALLEGYLEQAAALRDGRPSGNGAVRGVICPHIDYDRGGLVYARLWDRAREAVASADRFLVLGTDHAGGPGAITLTRQSYDTPLGTLPTDLEAVDMVAEAMGTEAAFAQELNHRVEHSVELAAVWLRHLAGDRDVKMVPVLCGSFHPYTEGEGRPTEDARWQAGAEALRRVAGRARTLVVAAADLAHMGPAFGDARPMGPVERAALSAADSTMLETICRGDAEGFLDLLTAERDRRKVCGLPPIYLMLKILGNVAGEKIAYSICPAPGESVVSVTGVLLSAPESRPKRH
jgi:AmmeMemoRadiSam system protein B